MPFVAVFLLLIVLPTASIVAFCAFVERKQRQFEQRNPGRQFGIHEYREQVAAIATCGWSILVAAVVAAFLALRLHDWLD
jgi:ABC-type uncharacterized transport system permease subunit